MDWKAYDWQSQKVGQKGEVLNRNDYRCGFCKGKGIISHNKAIRCPGCAGAGTVRIPGFVTICAYCNGDGRAPLNRDLTCNVCKGKGVVSIEGKDIEICLVCKGRGRERSSSLPCLKCRGKGVVPKPLPAGRQEKFNTENMQREDEILEENNSPAKPFNSGRDPAGGIKMAQRDNTEVSDGEEKR